MTTEQLRNLLVGDIDHLLSAPLIRVRLSAEQERRLRAARNYWQDADRLTIVDFEDYLEREPARADAGEGWWEIRGVAPGEGAPCLLCKIPAGQMTEDEAHAEARRLEAAGYADVSVQLVGGEGKDPMTASHSIEEVADDNTPVPPELKGDE